MVGVTLSSPGGVSRLVPLIHESDLDWAETDDGDDPLRYLAVSTMNEPDVTVYPEMDEVGVFAGAPPGGRSERSVHGYFDPEDAINYWE